MGRWVEVDELARFQKASGNAFSVSRNAWGLYLEDPHDGSFGYEGSPGFLDHRYLLCVLFEYAATLGLVDVAFVPPAGARPDYGGLWGSDELPFLSRYDGLLFVRLNALGAFCLGVANGYESAPREVKAVLRVLPDLDVVAIDAGLEPCDRMALDSYAVRTSDAVWKLERGKLLSAAEEGRSVAELRELLTAGSGAPLPQTVARLLEDVEARLARVRDDGPARLVECDEPALAALLANDSGTRRHCLRAGERHLVVPASSEAAFRRGLREVGYLLAAAKPSVAVGGRKAAKVTEEANGPGDEQPEEP